MVKTLPEDHPDVKRAHEAKGKFNQLRKRLRETEARLESMTVEYCRFHSLPRHERLELQAAAVLNDATLSNITKDDIERARGEIEVLRAAIDAQQRVVSIASGKPNKLLHSLNHDQYVQIQRRIVDAVSELAAANLAEAEFFEAMRDAGANPIMFRSMSISAIGTLQDPQSRASFHHREVAEHLPEALKAS